MQKVDIYTDGACSHNPGPGGWACVLLYGAHEREANGFEPHTTNNRMEMLAAIRALELLKRPCEVRLHSDSAYLCNGFNEGWVFNWIKNGWKTSSKKDVENIDLWQQLLELTRTHKVRFVKVRGHADNVNNNRCDALARAAIDEYRNQAGDSL